MCCWLVLDKTVVFTFVCLGAVQEVELDLQTGMRGFFFCYGSVLTGCESAFCFVSSPYASRVLKAPSPKGCCLLLCYVPLRLYQVRTGFSVG
jgi:hypothetical protein